MSQQTSQAVVFENATLFDGVSPKVATRMFVRVADGEIKGFVVRKLSSGKVTFGYRYRDPAGKQKWHGLGLMGSITAEQARILAKKRAGEVAVGPAVGVLGGADGAWSPRRSRSGTRGFRPRVRRRRAA